MHWRGLKLCNKYDARLENVIHVVRWRDSCRATQKEDTKSGMWDNCIQTHERKQRKVITKLFKVGKGGPSIQTWKRKETEAGCQQEHRFMDKYITKRCCVLVGAHSGGLLPPASSRIPVPFGSHCFPAWVSVVTQSHLVKANCIHYFGQHSDSSYSTLLPTTSYSTSYYSTSRRISLYRNIFNCTINCICA